MIPRMSMNMSDSLSRDKARADLYKESLLAMSRLLWSYLGYSGLGNPWHDDYNLIWSRSIKTVNGFIEFLDQEDITLESYAIFFFPLVSYNKYDRLGNLISLKSHRAWAKKLRDYAGSAEVFDETASLLLEFFQYQVEHDLKASIRAGSVIKPDINSRSGKYCEAYHMLVDRVKYFRGLGIDPVIWLREKIRVCKETFKDSPLNLKTIINMNGLEPKVQDLKTYSEDEWRDVRAFLGLSQDCVFVDGSIPKGWSMSSDDFDDAKNIVKIDEDGFYYYIDAAQRGCKCHYSTNKRLAIKCTPDNFEVFKPEWHDVRLRTARPTWEEYNQWAVYPGLWDAEGNALNERGKNIKWRVNGRKKSE